MQFVKLRGFIPCIFVYILDVDSGIEDWSDEMALLTNSINLSPDSEKKTYTNNLDSSDISTFTIASVVCDNTFDQNSISLVMTKDENVLENIYPTPLEDHSQTEAVRKDVMGKCRHNPLTSLLLRMFPTVLGTTFEIQP